jgi:hypothetical protein
VQEIWRLDVEPTTDESTRRMDEIQTESDFFAAGHAAAYVDERHERREQHDRS